MDSSTVDSPHRLMWLDVLRGLAALLVVYEHLGYFVMPGIRDATKNWVNAGDTGVFLFFLVSGYIIPASLERKGSLRGFWISRIFRLYPLFLCAYLSAYLLRRTGHFDRSDPYLRHHPAATLLAHSTMLQDLLGVWSSVNVMWSLSYEMAFYLVVTGLFVVGLNRFSVEVALLFGLAALLLCNAVGQQRLTTALGLTPTASLTAAVFFVGVAAVMTRSRILVLGGGLILGALALALLCLNSRLTPWEGLFVPACMFLGTAVFRADQGAVSRRRVGLAAAALVFLAVVSAMTAKATPGVSTSDRAIEARTFVLSALLAAAMFGVGRLLRARRFPRILGWFGKISFSIYLLHPLLSAAFVKTLHRYGGAAAPAWRQLATLGLFVAVVGALSSVTYLAIEQPTQRLGRTLSRWCEARLGPHARPAPGRGRVAELSSR